MKRFWQYWLSVVATASMTTAAIAQQDCVPGSLGSYQSIMSRAGINQGGYEMQPRNGAWGGSGQVVDSQGVVDGNVFHGQVPQTQGRNLGGQVQGGVVNGGQVYNGVPINGAVNGGVVNGGIVNGGQVYNGAVRSAPMTGSPSYAAPAYGGGAACGGGAVYGGGVASSSMVGGQTGYFDQGYAGDFADAGVAGGNSANWVVGARALFFTRNGESPVPLARNGAGDVLLSTVNDYGTMPGAEAILTRRTCNNMGMELRYWGLYPNLRDYTFNGPGLDTYLLGLNDFLIAPGAVNVLTYFNGADNLRVYRNNEVHNMEINGLRNGGSYTTFGGRTGTYELLAGARWFQFNEDYRFAAFNGAVNPMQINYDLATRNTLLGFQVGARNERCLTDRLSFMGGTRVGLYNNRSTARQSIYNETGDFAYLSGDPTAEYNFESQRDSLAMLGELDLGVGYRFTQKLRATIGYRLIGVSGVALAPNQIPRNFTNNAEINRVKSNDSLILGGGYVGLDMCF